MLVMLYYTSFLFGLVAWHAAIRHDVVIMTLSLIQTMCSILHHAHGTDEDAYFGGAENAIVDRGVARLLTVIVAWRNAHAGLGTAPIIVWLAIGYAMWSYFAKIYGTPPYVPGRVCSTSLWHASLHLVASCGLHAHLLC